MKKYFCDFLWWGSLQRGQLKKSPCRCKRTLYKIRREKKLSNSIKLDLPSCPLLPLIFIQRYTRSIFFLDFVMQYFVDIFSEPPKVSSQIN